MVLDLSYICNLNNDHGIITKYILSSICKFIPYIIPFFMFHLVMTFLCSWTPSLIFKLILFILSLIYKLILYICKIISFGAEMIVIRILNESEKKNDSNELEKDGTFNNNHEKVE